jgi:hypothetical protein
MSDRNPATREAREMLGVSPRADSAEIARAYRRRARDVHPDVSTDEDAGAQFSALLAAYQLLLATPPEPPVAPGEDDQGQVVGRGRRPHVPAPDLVGGWTAERAYRGVGWLVAGPVRVEPLGGTTRPPGSRGGRSPSR